MRRIAVLVNFHELYSSVSLANQSSVQPISPTIIINRPGIPATNPRHYYYSITIITIITTTLILIITNCRNAQYFLILSDQRVLLSHPPQREFVKSDGIIWHQRSATEWKFCDGMRGEHGNQPLVKPVKVSKISPRQSLHGQEAAG